MKKILIIILAGVLLHPLPTKAQFGQDAAALIGFLTPYLGALEALSEASGMEISDLKKITQQSIQLTSSLAKVYNAGNRLYRVSSRTHEIYIEYLETIKYIYDNSIYFEDEEASYHVAVLNKVVFGQADQDGKLSVNNIMDGAMEIWVWTVTDNKPVYTRRKKICQKADLARMAVSTFLSRL